MHLSTIVLYYSYKLNKPYRRKFKMKKIQKSKKGFTLVEMVLVIAIIVILAAVLVLGIGTYLQRARAASSSIAAHNSSISAVRAEIDHELS